MNIFKKISYMLAIGAVLFTTAACSDPDDELTSVEYDRLFSPTALDAKVQNKTNVRLSWECLSEKDANSYTIELFANDPDMACEGTATFSFTNVTENPYTITGLEGETTYSIRIKAVGETKESKWAVTTFETDAEQIFESVTEEDLTANSVILRWPAGQTATEIILSPDNLKHSVTSAEITAGAATISGLQAETTYTAKLMNGTKVRGTTTFTTLVDLGGAIAVTTEDDFAKMLEEAQDGDAFAFYPGIYTAPISEGKVGKINISKNIEIKAVRPSERPILNGCITLNDGASLSIKQVVLDGDNTDGSQAFDFKTATTYGALTIDDCEIRNYTKGFYYINVAATIDKITINNSLIHNIECNGGDLFDCRAGYIKVFNLTNSTVWNSCSSRDFVRYDDASKSFAGAAPVISIDHCTLDGVSNNSSRRLFYVRFSGNSITFTNNMVSNMPDCGRGFSDNSATAEPTFSNNNYHNTANLVSLSGEGKGKFYDTNGTTLNPNYKDAANSDFTLGNEDLSYKQIGDPRWY